MASTIEDDRRLVEFVAMTNFTGGRIHQLHQIGDLVRCRAGLGAGREQYLVDGAIQALHVVFHPAQELSLAFGAGIVFEQSLDVEA